jgi:hypothetical protein
MNRIFILASLLLIALSGCQPGHTLDPKQEDAHLYFVAEYHNAAWSYQHKVVLTTPEGEVRIHEFNGQTADVDPWQAFRYNPNVGSYFSLDDLTANVALAKVQSEQGVDTEEIASFGESIAEVREGEYKEEGCPGADMGATTLYALHWSEQYEYFEIILLKQTGDCLFTNQAQAAKPMISWLEGWAVPLL